MFILSVVSSIIFTLFLDKPYLTMLLPKTCYFTFTPTLYIIFNQPIHVFNILIAQDHAYNHYFHTCKFFHSLQIATKCIQTSTPNSTRRLLHKSHVYSQFHNLITARIQTSRFCLVYCLLGLYAYLLNLNC